MRELTRSMLRFSWAMPMLGLDQMVKLVKPGEGQRPLEAATETFDALAEEAERHMGPQLRKLYEQGDQLQRRVVDAAFSAVDAGTRTSTGTDGP